MDRGLMERLAALRATKARLEEELDAVKVELDAVQGVLVDQFLAAGVKSQKLDDGRTFWLRSQLWMFPKRGVAQEVAVAALQNAGLGDLVQPRYNAQTLAAWARERGDDPLPDALAEVFEVVAKTEIRVR